MNIAEKFELLFDKIITCIQSITGIAKKKVKKKSVYPYMDRLSDND